MWIKKLYATFGSLEGKALGFGKGLNIVYGRNESGKTTWCAFIRSMLFGIATREKEKAGYLPDKIKYLPKSGVMYGKAVIEKDGEEYILERTASSRTGVFSSESAKSASVGGNIAISDLVGISREVFERSFFISGSSLAVTGAGELEKKIISLASGGDEETSAAEAIARLMKKKRALRSPRGMGRLTELEAELRAIERGELPGGLQPVYDELRGLETEAAKRESAELAANLERVRAEQSIGRISAFEGMSDSLAETQAKRDIEKLRNAKKRKFPISAFLFAILAAVLGTVGYLWDRRIFIGAVISGAIAVICLAVSEILRIAKRKKTIRELSGKYKTVTEDGIASELSDYCEAFSRLEEAEMRAEKLSGGAVEIKKELRDKEKELRDKLEIAKRAEKERETGLLAEYRELSLEYESLTLATELIASAAEEFSGKFSPELERRASEIFARLTGGSFAIVRVKNADFEVDVAKGDAAPPQGELTLSRGTRDELLLSLRLALCDMLAEDGDELPIILDDVFVNFDDERTERTLEYLSEIAEKRQIIIFSCHRREAEFMHGRATVVEL